MANFTTSGDNYTSTLSKSDLSTTATTTITIPTTNTYADKNIVITVPKVASVIDTYSGAIAVTTT